MANAMYDFGRQEFAAGNLDWDAHNFKAALIDEADDTINLATDDFWDDRAGAAIVADSANLASKTNVAGVLDADDVTWSAVSGDPCESIDIRRDTGSAATSPLICNIDTATGLPVAPGGGDIIARWDAGANKILKI